MCKRVLLTFYIFSLVSKHYCYSQNFLNSETVNAAYEKIVDSIWINQQLWQRFNTVKLEDQYCIKNIEEARKCELIKIPFYNISSEEFKYNTTSELFDGISLSQDGLWVIVNNNGKPIGRLDIINNHGQYDGILIDVFNTDTPMERAINKLIIKSPDQLFSFSHLGGVWYTKGNKIRVYSFKKNRIMNPKSYIRKHNLESIIERELK